MRPALAFATILLLAQVARTQDAPTDPRIAERNRLAEQAQALQAKGDLAGAREALTRVLALEEAVFGAVHEEVFNTHKWLALVCRALRDFDAAREHLKRALAIRTKLSGQDHWKTTDARLDLEWIDRWVLLSDDDRKALSQAVAEGNRVEALIRAGSYEEALAPAKTNLATCERVLGPNHQQVAVYLGMLCIVYQELGEYSKALPLCERALEISEKTRGPAHPYTANSLNNLALLHRSQGEYAKALRLCRRLLAIQEESLGPEHPWTVNSLNNLAMLYLDMGEHAKALALQERALAISERTLGPEHPDTARNLSNLALFHARLGDHGKALPLYERAWAVVEKTLGPEHPKAATVLNSLAVQYGLMGEYEKALPLHERALEIKEKSLGPEHPETATVLQSLAMLHRDMGDYAKALALQERALAIREKSLGPEHPDTASSLAELGLLYHVLGEYGKALPLYERALAIQEKSLGPEHPNTAASLGNLAILDYQSGHLELAHPLAVRALRAKRSLLDSLAVVQSERQQLQQFADAKRGLDLCLSTGAGEAAEDLYPFVLRTTGLVFARQTFLRAQRSRPELAEVFAAYKGVCRALSKQLLATPAPEKAEARFARIRELSARQEELEAELAKKSEEFREERSSRWLGPAELAAALPEDAALVDFLTYRRLLPREAGAKARWEERYIAFVVRPGAEVARVDLGPAETIDALVAAWRKAAGAGRIPKEGAALREALWRPVEPLLGNAKTVLVSPDAALCSLPFAALPGGEAGSFLVDEYRFAVVPVPRLLPSLLAREATREKSLLLVGEVDYGAAPGAPPHDVVVMARTAPRGGLRGAWEPLPGTRAEVLAVRDSFELRFPDGQTKALRRQAATEEAFREAAAKHRWLHVATHGFFAPEEVRSALADAGRVSDLAGEDRVVGFHPGLLSGIVLAGANQPVTTDGDDGILTALEVASLDLSRTEMVVLSACETGLGKVAGGEGVLGLQRAFQVAGARSTVTSLWKVDDRATNLLMTVFYEKLWGEGLPRAEALRQAQLQLMRDQGIRGLAVKDAADGKAPDRLPPLYWAGFVLAGDWR